MRIFVPLRKNEVDLLIKQAVDERRRPQDQAAFLLGKVLRGELTEPMPIGSREPVTASHRQEARNAA